MEIINIKKLDGHKIIVLTGRYEHVRKIAKHLQASLYHCPRDTDYFMDYYAVINGLQEHLTHVKDIVIITTQSAEFLDCLLTSNMDFILATVRQLDRDDNDTYRLRVLTKKEAWENRRSYNMELRC